MRRLYGAASRLIGLLGLMIGDFMQPFINAAEMQKTPGKVEFRSVPITPTPEMVRAGHKEAIWGSGDVVKVWEAMLKAAPNAGHERPARDD